MALVLRTSLKRIVGSNPTVIISFYLITRFIRLDQVLSLFANKAFIPLEFENFLAQQQYNEHIMVVSYILIQLRVDF